MNKSLSATDQSRTDWSSLALKREVNVGFAITTASEDVIRSNVGVIAKYADRDEEDRAAVRRILAGDTDEWGKLSEMSSQFGSDCLKALRDNGIPCRGEGRNSYDALIGSALLSEEALKGMIAGVTDCLEMDRTKSFVGGEQTHLINDAEASLHPCDMFMGFEFFDIPAEMFEA